MRKRKVTGIISAVAIAGLLMAGTDSLMAATVTAQGSAYKNEDKSYTLTDNYAQAGMISYDKKLNTKQGFEVSFDYNIGEGHPGADADGLAAVFTDAPGRVGRAGCDIGIPTADTMYAVELDTFFGDATHTAEYDPTYQHIGLVGHDFTNHLATKECDKLSDREWHTLKIVYKNKTLTAYIDETKYLESKKAVLPDAVYFSIAAGSGDYYNVEKVRNISMKQYSVKMKESSVILKKNDLHELSYTAVGYDNAKATWTSSDTSVAKVSSTGKIKAVGAGTCTITCKLGTATAKVKVAVKPTKITGMKKGSVKKDSIELKWDKQDGVTKYEVYEYDSDFEEYTLVKTVDGKSTGVKIEKLSKNTNYKFQIRAYVKFGNKKVYGTSTATIKIRTAK